MISNFLNSENFTSRYEVSFSYRYSVEYERGLKERVNLEGKDVCPLNVKDIYQFTFKDNFKYFPKSIYRFLLGVFFVRQLLLCWNTWVVLRFIRGKPIDIIVINNGGFPGASSCNAAVFAAKISGIKHIFYIVNNMAISYRPLWRWPDLPFDFFLKKSVDLFITGSQKAAMRLSSVLNLTRQQVINIPNGISLRLIDESKIATRERLGVIPGKIVIGVVAVLEKRKGHIILLEAIRLLCDSVCIKESPVVLIEGNGRELGDLKDFVDRNGLNPLVRFVGNERNISNFINACDVIILPSIDNEDFPNITLEAMGHGKTVIASDIAGVPEQIDHMGNGILVRRKDSKELCNAIRMVCFDEKLRERLGEEAKKRFEHEFTSAVAVERYCSLFENTLNKDII